MSASNSRKLEVFASNELGNLRAIQPATKYIKVITRMKLFMVFFEDFNEFFAKNVELEVKCG